MIPVFATRGATQLLRFGVIGFVLTVEIAGLVTLAYRVSRTILVVGFVC